MRVEAKTAASDSLGSRHLAIKLRVTDAKVPRIQRHLGPIMYAQSAAWADKSTLELFLLPTVRNKYICTYVSQTIPKKKFSCSSIGFLVGLFLFLSHVLEASRRCCVNIKIKLSYPLIHVHLYTYLFWAKLDLFLPMPQKKQFWRSCLFVNVIQKCQTLVQKYMQNLQDY